MIHANELKTGTIYITNGAPYMVENLVKQTPSARGAAVRFARLLAAGKPKMVALVAVLRKMLHVLNRLLADPDFVLVR